jgi:hypothetical protein
MEYQPIVNPNGTISIVPVNQQQGIMVPAYETSQLDLVDQINQRPKNIGVPMNLEETMAGSFLPPDPRRFQSIFPPEATGIMQKAPLQNLGIDTSYRVANEEDVEQVDSLTGEKKGLAKIFDFLQQFSPVQMIGKGIGAFFNPKESDRYRPATAGIYGYSPRELNQMNALGGYYSEPARAQRRLENRLANLIKRRDEGKSYSQKNLDSITQSLSGAASQAQFATKKAAAKSPKVGVSGYTAKDDVRESRRGKV